MTRITRVQTAYEPLLPVIPKAQLFPCPPHALVMIKYAPRTCFYAFPSTEAIYSSCVNNCWFHWLIPSNGQQCNGEDIRKSCHYGVRVNHNIDLHTTNLSGVASGVKRVLDSAGAKL